MPAMTSSGSFRSGLVVPEHRQLYDYWASLHRNGETPCRSDFKPSAIGRLLPSLTLIDIVAPLAKSRIRLAGTRVVEIHNAEITGRALDELGWDQHHSYWLGAIDKAANRREPVSGMLTGSSINRNQVARYWLRLPMRNRTEDITIVLGHDIVIPVAGQNEYRKMVTF